MPIASSRRGEIICGLNLLESLRDERESKGERFDVLATVLRILVTPAPDSFNSGIHLDPLVELYTFVDLDFAFGIFEFQLYLRMLVFSDCESWCFRTVNV